MHVTPPRLIAHRGHKLSQAELVQVVRTEVSLTHPSPVIQDTTTAYCLAIAHLIRHPLDRAGAWEAVVAWAAHADRTVKEWLDLAASATDVPFAPQIGWARIAFVHAFRHLRNGSTYLGALTAVLRGGGDTDTNACIAGGLIGAAVGASGIPLGAHDPLPRMYTTLHRSQSHHLTTPPPHLTTPHHPPHCTRLTYGP